MSTKSVGLQLYTLRDETSKDFIETLKKVADIGYKTVEFAGYGGIEGKKMKSVLDDLGLKAVSSHVAYELLVNELPQQIEYCLEIGAKYIVCPFMQKERFYDEKEFASIIDTFKTIGNTVARSGLQFAYHNHDFEFGKAKNDQYILDTIYAEVDADILQAELDLYWIKKAGLEPKDYLLSYEGRVPLLHIKDMAADEAGSFAEVGHGIINYPELFEAAEKCGVKHYIVEQDKCQRDPLESIQMSMDYLKSIGIA